MGHFSILQTLQTPPGGESYPGMAGLIPTPYGPSLSQQPFFAGFPPRAAPPHFREGYHSPLEHNPIQQQHSAVGGTDAHGKVLTVFPTGQQSGANMASGQSQTYFVYPAMAANSNPSPVGSHLGDTTSCQVST